MAIFIGYSGMIICISGIGIGVLVSCGSVVSFLFSNLVYVYASLYLGACTCLMSIFLGYSENAHMQFAYSQQFLGSWYVGVLLRWVWIYVRLFI